MLPDSYPSNECLHFWEKESELEHSKAQKLSYIDVCLEMLGINLRLVYRQMLY